MFQRHRLAAASRAAAAVRAETPMLAPALVEPTMAELEALTAPVAPPVAAPPVANATKAARRG